MLINTLDEIPVGQRSVKKTLTKPKFLGKSGLQVTITVIVTVINLFLLSVLTVAPVEEKPSSGQFSF